LTERAGSVGALVAVRPVSGHVLLSATSGLVGVTFRAAGTTATDLAATLLPQPLRSTNAASAEHPTRLFRFTLSNLRQSSALTGGFARTVDILAVQPPAACAAMGSPR